MWCELRGVGFTLPEHLARILPLMPINQEQSQAADSVDTVWSPCPQNLHSRGIKARGK